MVLTAYAKINLGLRVLGKREDGFHDIETIFHRINLFDELNIEPADDFISISSTNQTLPTNENNLCWKAVELLRTEVGTTHGAAIHLRKISQSVQALAEEAAMPPRCSRHFRHCGISPSMLQPLRVLR